MSEATLEIRHITDFQPDPRNANKGTQRGLSLLEDSIAEDGAGRSMLATADGVLIAGNKTQAALIERGIEEVIVIHTDGTRSVIVQRDDVLAGTPHAQRMGVRDNRTSEVGLDWDVDVLDSLDIDLGGLFFDSELAELGIGPDEQPEDPGPQIDKAAELQEKWQVARGQVWEIGKHKLMCGDSMSAEDVGWLMGGAVAVGINDPPYGISLNQEWLSRLHAKAGKPRNIAADETITGDDGTLDVSCAFGFNKWLVWGFPYLAHPGMTGWLVWDKWPGADGGLGNPVELACTNLWQGFRLVRLMWGGYYRAAGENREPHPTQKPVGVILPYVEQFVNEGAIVADLFLGSGTTMVAAEQTGRICYGMEIEPKYCSVTLERMAGIGLEPRLSE